MSNSRPSEPFPCESLWDAICQTVSSYVVVVDREGTILFINRVEEGLERSHVLGMKVTDFLPAHDRERVVSILHDIHSTGRHLDYMAHGRKLSGEASYYRVHAGPVMAGGRIVAAMLCADDELPLRLSEASLRHERQVLRKMLEIQERERQLVAYEIHDGLAQYLAGAILHVQALEHSLETAGQPADADMRSCDESLRLLRAAVDESRRLISGLRPPVLDELGLVAAVESLVAEARDAIGRITFEHSLPTKRLPPQIEAIIFRIIQESLSNVRKHSRARSASISIRGVENHLVVRVSDDGRGFVPEDVPEDRFGLEGIRQRAGLMGGTCVLTTKPGFGTTVEVTLPIPITTGQQDTRTAAPSAEP